MSSARFDSSAAMHRLAPVRDEELYFEVSADAPTTANKTRATEIVTD